MEEVKETNEQQVSELLQIRRDKLTELQEAGRDPFRETRFDRDATSAGIKGAFEDYENKQVTIAGRIMSKRGMGKAIFCHIQDREGQIQLGQRNRICGLPEIRCRRHYRCQRLRLQDPDR